MVGCCKEDKKSHNIRLEDSKPDKNTDYGNPVYEVSKSKILATRLVAITMIFGKVSCYLLPLY